MADSYDLSRLSNATADVARSMARFERDFARMQREAQAALRAGVSEHRLTTAMNERVKGHPDLQRRLKTLVEGLKKHGAQSSGD